MKAATILLLYVSVVGCTESSTTRQDGQPSVKVDTSVNRNTNAEQDTVTWIDHFRNLRTALYHADKQKVKTYFNFPVSGSNNDIWYLVNSKAESPGEAQPFTEQDFDKYYSKLFPKIFVTGLLKIKTSDLYNKGESETPELQDGSTNYKVYATCDKKEKTLTLNLALNTPVKMENGEQENEETNVIYIFSVLESGQLRFKGVRLAG